MNEHLDMAVEQPSVMVQAIVEYDENGNPIAPVVNEAGDEVVREVFVQTEETIN